MENGNGEYKDTVIKLREEAEKHIAAILDIERQLAAFNFKLHVNPDRTCAVFKITQETYGEVKQVVNPSGSHTVN
jgi:hypothetical protein